MGTVFSQRIEDCVLVCLGCCNRISQTGGFNHIHFSQSGGWKSMIKVLADLCLVRIHFLACRQLPSFDILMWQREGSYVSPSFFFYKGTNAILEGSTLMSSSPPKGPHFQIPSQWRLVFNIWILGFPGGASDKESACQWRGWKRSSFDPWARKIPWRRKWQQTPVLLTGKFHGQRSLVDYHPRGHKESDMTEIMSIWILRGNKYSVHSS